MSEYILTEINEDLATKIVEYTRLECDHGVTSIEKLKGGVFKTEYNGDYIYYDEKSLKVLISTSSKIKKQYGQESI